MTQLRGPRRSSPGAPGGANLRRDHGRKLLVFVPLLLATAALAQDDAPSHDRAQSVIVESCRMCHNDAILIGNLSLEAFEASAAERHPEVAEKVIRKLRAGMMPPPGAPRPDDALLDELASLIETRVDDNARARPNPGRRSFQRLNRAEYSSAIESLLGMEVDAGAYLPLDTKSANFDNIADVQMLSATLMEGYLRAASEISRLAVGDAQASARETTYKVTRWESQIEQAPGAPYGTRGGVAPVHSFPADGEYTFRVSFHHETTGALYGSAPAALHTAEAPEQIEISIDGERVALFDIDRWMHVSDPNGMELTTEPIFVHAGPHQVAAAFVRKTEGPVQDLIGPHDWSIASTSIADAYGLTSLPHLRDLAITGPFNPTSVSETPTRQKIFSCRPDSGDDPVECARSIIERLASQAYRRPLDDEDIGALMKLFEVGTSDGGFEVGIRTALEGILASPHFAFRFEEPPPGADPREGYAVSDFDLASRLSFFLWGTPPDDELSELASQGRLADPGALEAQAKRMLADPRSRALATRFASQWLRMSDLDKMHPNVRTYPNFHDQLKESMRIETRMFFNSLVDEDRSVLELLSADYTFVDERLAAHYGMSGVTGNEFRRVRYEDDQRRGILGHGSILTLTSHASRTSPVLRGKWMMEVLLGTPPPPPPPGVPELEDAGEAEGGRMLSVREQMERHRADPTCSSCHKMIDPLGLALENFDATGAWRIRDKDVPVDATGELYDGTPLTGPADLRGALLGRSTSLVRTFAENLMAYALGRRVEHYDMPQIRRIERDAAAEDYKISSFILGVVKSPAFRVKAGLSPEASGQQ